MSDRDDGGPAFAHGDPTHGGDPGMSLRDYFAGQALAGLVMNKRHIAFHPTDDAKWVYELADAMLEAR